MRKLFREVFLREKFTMDHEFDWVLADRKSKTSSNVDGGDDQDEWKREYSRGGA